MVTCLTIHADLQCNGTLNLGDYLGIPNAPTNSEPDGVLYITSLGGEPEVTGRLLIYSKDGSHPTVLHVAGVHTITAGESGVTYKAHSMRLKLLVSHCAGITGLPEKMDIVMPLVQLPKGAEIIDGRRVLKTTKGEPVEPAKLPDGTRLSVTLWNE